MLGERIFPEFKVQSLVICGKSLENFKINTPFQGAWVVQLVKCPMVEPLPKNMVGASSEQGKAMWPNQLLYTYA